MKKYFNFKAIIFHYLFLFLSQVVILSSSYFINIRNDGDIDPISFFLFYGLYGIDIILINPIFHITDIKYDSLFKGILLVFFTRFIFVTIFYMIDIHGRNKIARTVHISFIVLNIICGTVFLLYVVFFTPR